MLPVTLFFYGENMRYIITLLLLIISSVSYAATCGSNSTGNKKVFDNITYTLGNLKNSTTSITASVPPASISFPMGVANIQIPSASPDQSGVSSGSVRVLYCNWFASVTAATCTDGLKNGTETDTDCGGTCVPCAPTCTPPNGLKDQDETGIDCGGCTGVECQPTCLQVPAGCIGNDLIDENNPTCDVYCPPPPDGGECPDGMTKVCTDAMINAWNKYVPASCSCESSEPPFLAGPATPPPPVPPVYPVAPPPAPEVERVVVSSPPPSAPEPVTPASDPSAPAGAVTKIINHNTTVISSGGGSGTGSTVTETTTTYYGSGGEVVGTGKEISTEGDPTGGAGDGPSGEDIAALDGTNLDTVIESPEELDLITTLTDWFDAFPLVGMINSFSIQTSAAVCAVPIGELYNTDMTIDLCRYEVLLRSMGAILILFCQGYAILVVVKGWK